MRVADLVRALEQRAPLHVAEPWDNVGLLWGSRDKEISRVLLAIDFTPEVLAEALKEQCDAAVVYHPPIFEGLKRIPAGSVVYEAIRHNLPVYCVHTALDAAMGGTNDVLAEALGLRDLVPLRTHVPKADSAVKLVTFVPVDAVQKVSAALFAAGAGEIGNYTQCSFRVNGTGTFRGNEASSPVVGKALQLEDVEEVRLEVVVPQACVGAVVAALVRSHPYEEPAFDLLRLAPAPSGVGMGRVGVLPHKQTRRAFVEQIRAALGIDAVLVAGSLEKDVTRVAVCAGAGGEFLRDAINAKADVYVTGELRHHDALKAKQRGMTLVCTRHSHSERLALARVAEYIAGDLTGVSAHVSVVDREPFEFVGAALDAPV